MHVLYHCVRESKSKIYHASTVGSNFTRFESIGYSL